MTRPLSPDSARPENARLAMLYEVSQRISASLDLSETLALVLDSALGLTGAERGFLMLWDEENERLAFHLARTHAGEALTEFEFQISRTLIYSVAQNGAPILTTNSQTHTLFGRRPDAPPFVLRSLMAVPLRAHGQTTGVIYVDNKAHDAQFRPPDLDFLSAFASPAAVAIENARFYTQTAHALAARVADLQALQQLTQILNAPLALDRILRATLDLILTRTGATAGWAGTVDNEQFRVRVTVTRNAAPSGLAPDAPLVAAALSTREPQRTFTTHEDEATQIVIPLTRAGQVLALLVVARVDEPLTYASEDFLMRLAAPIALALENARLLTAVQEAQAAKNKFVSIVTHELKIPMTPIKGYADLILQGLVGPVTDQQKQFLNTIRNNVERMAVLVNDLADISRIETGRLKTELGLCPVSEFMNAALIGLQPLIENKGQTLTVSLPADLPLVYTDPARLAQVFTNLLGNAHKYTPSGGALTISAEAIPNFVRVSVTDTGIGISPADQARLFTPFFRSEDAAVREQPGWGLGLQLSKLLIELLGGQITAHSELGRGSVFTFTVPLAKVAG